MAVALSSDPVMLNHPNDRYDLTLVYPSTARLDQRPTEGHRPDACSAGSIITENQNYKSSPYYCAF